MKEKEYKDIRCPFCKMRVRAELVRQEQIKEIFICPNKNAEGVFHTFTLPRGALKYLKFGRAALSIFAGMK